ncbi:alpha-L-rhamnosidase [Niabella terrae]
MSKWMVIFVLFWTVNAGAQPLQLNRLRCDYRVDPSGVDSEKPMLSWEIQSREKNVLQQAYRILVADDSLLLSTGRANVWDSRKVSSSASVQVPYQGPQLQPARKYFWKVMVWDQRGRRSDYSPIARWQMGLMGPEGWRDARWIAYEILPDSNIYLPLLHGNGKKAWGRRPDVLPLLRKSFGLKKSIKSATAFVSGLGHFELHINGKKISNHFLDPGWTQYSKAAQYVSFDISKDLRSGANVVGIMLGNGFYYIPGQRYRKMTGAYGYPKLKATILLEYSDGSRTAIVTDSSWKTAPSPIWFSSIFGGEDYDARAEQTGWDQPGFDDSGWKSALETTGPPLLQSQIQEALIIAQRFAPRQQRPLADGSWVFDLGQNFSGIPAIEVSGRRGDTIRIIPSELVNEDGSANQKGTGGLHVYTYVLKGTGTESWQPRFSYYGFRYLQVTGAVPKGADNPDNLPELKTIQGLHIRNRASQIGNFHSSNALLNQTNELILWAIKSNMVSVFTDCPHREKLGWLEQTHLMGSSVQYNFDVAALNRKVIRDMEQAQYADGKMPEIAPEFTVFTPPFDESPEWGSAAVILPWYQYLWYGDRQYLAGAYPMMKGYVMYLEQKSKDHLLSHGLGDWFDIGPNRPGVAQLTPLGVTATAMYYYDLTLLTQAADLLGHKADAARFRLLGTAVRKAFNKKYFDRVTRQYATGSQTANAIALYTGLVEPQYKEAVLDNLIADIRNRNYALTAGDIGYRYVLRALEQAGRSDIIYAMNNRSDVPGYGYQLAHGATALTESWQAYPNVSNNHFMLGHLMEWFYSGLCGIGQAPGSVAFKEIEIRPQPVAGLDQARAAYQSVYGPIEVGWQQEAALFKLKVTIPPNTRGRVFFPKEYQRSPESIGSGTHEFILRMKKG